MRKKLLWTIALACICNLAIANDKKDVEEMFDNVCQDLWVKFDASKVDKYYNSDFVGYEGNAKFDLAAMKKDIEVSGQKYKDASCHFDHMVIDDDYVAARLTYTVTDKASNKQKTSYGIGIWHMKHDKVSEAWLAFEPTLD